MGTQRTIIIAAMLLFMGSMALADAAYDQCQQLAKDLDKVEKEYYKAVQKHLKNKDDDFSSDEFYTKIEPELRRKADVATDKYNSANCVALGFEVRRSLMGRNADKKAYKKANNYHSGSDGRGDHKKGP
jgi:predicted translin family RNA/ssDNA-binding protein